jgi:uncharacterized phage protein (TIGR01671 family)
MSKPESWKTRNRCTAGNKSCSQTILSRIAVSVGDGSAHGSRIIVPPVGPKLILEVKQMHEILFRGQRVDTGEWVFGMLCQYHAGVSAKIAANDFGTYEQGMAYCVNPATVGQYTGLTDRNGVKIFEGDILRLSHDWGDGTTDVWLAIVEFGNPNGLYSWGWQLRYLKGCSSFNKDILCWVDMEDTRAWCEVVGNVHDNPECKS